jgi:hypothetical protein
MTMNARPMSRPRPDRLITAGGERFLDVFAAAASVE